MFYNQSADTRKGRKFYGVKSIIKGEANMTGKWTLAVTSQWWNIIVELQRIAESYFQHTESTFSFALVRV